MRVRKREKCALYVRSALHRENGACDRAVYLHPSETTGYATAATSILTITLDVSFRAPELQRYHS